MRKLAKFLSVTLLLCLLATPALAASETVQAALTYRDIKITVDGTEITPTDVNGSSTEPFVMDGTTYLPIRAISEALGCDVVWDDATNSVIITTEGVVRADDAIKSVFAIGFADVDGAKVKAIAVEYVYELENGTFSLDDFEIQDYGTLFDPACELGGDPGVPLKAYVNNECAISSTGGTEKGNYVIIEVNTDYQMNNFQNYKYRMAVGVKQVGTIKTDEVTIVPSADFSVNYDFSVVEKTKNGVTTYQNTYTARDGSFSLENLECFELHSVALGNAFHAVDCFEQATGEYMTFDMGYSLFVPEDYDENGSYALYLHVPYAGGVGDDPMIALTTSLSAYNFTTDEVQGYAKAQGLDGVIVVVPQIPSALRSTRDNNSISAAVPATWQLMDYITDNYAIDMDRIYGSGHSMGGMQVAEMAVERDNYFAGLWLIGCQWGSNFHLEEPYEGKVYYNSPCDGTIITNPDFENFYYSLSDDNLLITNCAGDPFSTTVWNEVKYLYQDIAGVEFPYTKFNPLTETVEAQNASLKALLAENSDNGFYWMAFEDGSHTATWIYAHKIFAGYEWLLSQTKTSEDTRGKLEELNNPWAAETDEAKIAAKQTEDRYINDGVYFAVPAEGAGTNGYNGGWFNPQGDVVKAPGWTPAE